MTERIARAAEYPIAAIIAPAGFGKSVALSDYLETQRIDHVRYDVRADQNTLFEFVRGFAKALQGRIPQALGSFAGAQERAMAAKSAPEELSRWILEHLQSSMTVVIDDLHNAAEDPRSIEFLASIIERSHDRVRWIVASRSALTLPLASWLAYEKMDAQIDEHDLRFTIEEALAAAEDGIAGEEGAQELLELTSGWPVAYSIALRTSARISDLQRLADGTREVIYRYLAEQVYHRLPPDQQRVLIETCVYSSLDRSIMEQRGDNPDALNRLRRDAGFIYASSELEYRYHDLFREFLESELRAKGEVAYRDVLRTAARTLESLERDAEALSLYVRAVDLDETLRLLEERGFELIDRGRTDVVEAALEIVPEERRAAHSLALGMDAVLASRRGFIDIAEERYKLAMERSKRSAIRAQLVYRYAIDLVRAGRADAIAILEPYADDETLDVSLRAAILGTLATAQIQAGNPSNARRYIEQALTTLERSPNAILRAKIYQQAAYVMFFSGDPARCVQYANRAIDLAVLHGVFEVAARAYSMLYNVSNDVDDDPIASLRILDDLENCARKAGSAQMQLFALLAVYDIEGDRGDETAMARLDEQIDRLEMSLPQWVSQSLLPARARRKAWNGEFAEAYALLEDTAARQGTPERRALRWAEISVYALAAVFSDAAEKALAAAHSELNACESPASTRFLRTSLLLAVAELMRGKEAAAHRLLTDVERLLQPPMRRLRAFARAVRAIYNRVRDPENSTGVTATMERLRAEQLGGIARLLSVLPFASAEAGGLGSLTASERAILRALVSGASSKLIASQTGRSAQTVDVHIRSICRKLGCRGRIEAIALARSAGWLEDKS